MIFFAKEYCAKNAVFYKIELLLNAAKRTGKYTGASPSGKAAVFGTAIRRFESFRPNSLSLSRDYLVNGSL
ncbi:MAG: hypothetical protein K0S07_936 [Chlamydiales bacterium]|nr:hypothetical protein [Chlamydiales bacterium]